MNAWIKCSDRLPHDDERVIVYCVLEDERTRRTTRQAAKYIDSPNNGHFQVPTGWVVTHWMPMPEPPPEDEYKKAPDDAANIDREQT